MYARRALLLSCQRPVGGCLQHVSSRVTSLAIVELVSCDILTAPTGAELLPLLPQSSGSGGPSCGEEGKIQGTDLRAVYVSAVSFSCKDPLRGHGPVRPSELVEACFQMLALVVDICHSRECE